MKFLPVYLGSVSIFAAVATSASAATQQLSPVYATSYGVTCNGTTDDTAAMQAAHNTGRVVIYPAGTCKFSTLTIASGGIVGEGVGAFPGQPGGTFLLTTDKGSGNTISYVADYSTGSSGVFRNFALFPSSGAAQKSGGSGLYISGNVGGDTRVLHGALVDGVWITYFPTALTMANAADWTVANNHFVYYSVAGLVVSNAIAPDQGDSSVYGNTFYNATAAPYGASGTGILQNNSGGLKITSNKFNGGAYGYQLNLLAQTSDVLISNNSFENISTAAITFTNNTNTASKAVRFTNEKITGNEFGGNARDIWFQQIANYNNQSYWDSANIVGNIFYGTTGTSVEMASSRFFTIASNTFNFVSAAITIDASCDNHALVGINGIFNASTGITNKGPYTTVAPY
jgi:hypothetical protein